MAIKIWMITDLEGVAGVLNFDDWCKPEGRYYETAKRLLTHEVNAAISGFFAGGSDAVTVIDGHGPGAINPELLDERAILVRGLGETMAIPPEYAAVAYVGQHAKAGTPYSHLTHTGTCAVLDKTVNGVSIGEYGDGALLAAEAGIPVIFAAGEAALCKEAAMLTPGVETVAVKWGLLPDDGMPELSGESYEKAKLSAAHLAPAMACRKIAAGAQAAMERYRAVPAGFHACDIHAPFHLVTRFRAIGDYPPQKLEARHPNFYSQVLMESLTRWNLVRYPEK